MHTITYKYALRQINSVEIAVAHYSAHDFSILVTIAYDSKHVGYNPP